MLIASTKIYRVYDQSEKCPAIPFAVTFMDDDGGFWCGDYTADGQLAQTIWKSRPPDACRRLDPTVLRDMAEKEAA